VIYAYLVDCALLVTSYPIQANSIDTLKASSLVDKSAPLLKELNISIPVSWEVSSSGFTEQGVASESESYRETWTYQQQLPFNFYLESPRAKVPVIVLRENDSMEASLDTIGLSKASLAKLLGLPVAEDKEPEGRTSYDFFLENPSELLFIKTKTEGPEIQLHLNLATDRSLGISMRLH